MVQQIIREEDGYTLIEILIAITIVSIVLGIASTVFVFASGQLNKWSSNMEFYNNAQIIHSQVYQDMLNAPEFVFTDTTLIIQKDQGVQRVYDWGNGRMVLNNQDLILEGMDSLIIQPNEKMINSNQEKKLISWSVIQKSKGTRFEVEQVVNVRNPVYWKPLRENN